MIVDAAVQVRTDALPLVERCEEPAGPVYVVTFEDADVSVRLGEAQIRALGSRILSATLDELED